MTTYEEQAVTQEYISAGAVHAFYYCPRLMYYQNVEGVLVLNADMVEGTSVHSRVDVPSQFSYPEEILQNGRETIRSLALADEELGINGVIDLLKRQDDGSWKVLDYKRGAPQKFNGEAYPKDNDARQVQIYAHLAYHNGYNVSGAAVYYAETKQLVPVPLCKSPLEIKEMIEAVRTCRNGSMPNPLDGDVRCLYCSLYSVCMPDETLYWKRQRKCQDAVRPPMPDNTPQVELILTSPQAYLSKRNDTFVVKENGEEKHTIPVHTLGSIRILGVAQMSTQVIQTCLKEGISVSFFSPAGMYIGRLDTLGIAGLDSRRGQYRLAENEKLSVKIASNMIRAKIANQRTMLMRNGRNLQRSVLDELKELQNAAMQASTRDGLMGVEGRAAALYFANFPAMITEVDFASSFSERNRRPPRDPVNALLSLGYSVLSSEITGICHTAGLDPACGILHAPRYGRPALALDLMEEFRPLIVDSVVISLINRCEIEWNDFAIASTGCMLKPSGHRAFWTAYARRMAEELIHPTFKYKMSYRRLLEVQVQQLWRLFRGDMTSYHSIVTR